MQLVFGDSPVAVALANHLGTRDACVLTGPTARTGSFLWRYSALDTGEGVKAAAKGAGRVFVVLDNGPTERTSGLFVILRSLDVQAGVLITGTGRVLGPGERAFAHWPRIELGPCWGETEPLHHAWSVALRAGDRLWLCDPGPIHAVPMDEAVRAIIAIQEHPKARWRMVSDDASRLPAMAQDLANSLGCALHRVRTPFSMAMRRVGIDPERIRTWMKPPPGPRYTPGWNEETQTGPQTQAPS